MVHTRWSNSFVGEEYARIYSWGNDPKRKVSSRYSPAANARVACSVRSKHLF
jgi:hypothetical protein